MRERERKSKKVVGEREGENVKMLHTGNERVISKPSVLHQLLASGVIIIVLVFVVVVAVTIAIAIVSQSVSQLASRK